MALGKVAGVITSGPDRLVPLSSLGPASHRGFVIGHRLPREPGAEGIPLDVVALRSQEAGISPVKAVRSLTDVNPQVAACPIAVTVASDAMACAETARVGQRTDRGQATA